MSKFEDLLMHATRNSQCTQLRKFDHPKCANGSSETPLFEQDERFSMTLHKSVDNRRLKCCFCETLFQCLAKDGKLVLLWVSYMSCYGL